MPQIDVITRSFPASSKWGIINRRRPLNFDLTEVIHAAITVGHRDYRTVLGGSPVSAASEMLWKISSTLLTLRDDYGRFVVTDRFSRLDPSEKRGLTYQMGMTFNKALAWRLFRVRWLMHLDVYHDLISPTIHAGRSRPDLVGVDDDGDWYVFESKGRTSPPSLKDKKKAKDQAGRIISIGGKTPTLASSCFTYFKGNDHFSHVKQAECFLEDPPFDDEKNEKDHHVLHEMHLSTEKIILDYYRPMLDLLSLGTKNNNRDAISWTDESLDIEISMEKWLIEAVKAQEAGKILEYFSEVDKEDQNKKMSDQRAAYDGINVILGPSWSENFSSER